LRTSVQNGENNEQVDEHTDSKNLTLLVKKFGRLLKKRKW